jgi:hypothetical protein
MLDNLRQILATAARQTNRYGANQHNPYAVWSGPFECPLCGKEKLYIYFDQPAFVCFSHGTHIRGYGESFFIQTICEPMGMTTVAQAQRFFEAGKKQRKHNKNTYAIPSKITLGEAYDLFPKSTAVRTAVEYCQSKWALQDTWRQLYFGFDFSDTPRIFIPLYDTAITGETTYCGFQARTIFPEIQPKLITPGMDKSRFLFNYETVAKQSDIVIVWESIFDTFIAPDISVALLGTTMTEKQIERFAAFKTIVICFDGDAMQKAQKHMGRIQQNFPEFNVIGRLYALNIQETTQIDHIKNEFCNQTLISAYKETKKVKQVIPLEHIHYLGGGHFARKESQ